MATTICLNCHFWGDKPDRIFTVEISLNNNVSDLKYEVKARNNIVFRDTEGSDIRLAKFKVPPLQVVPFDVESNTEELYSSAEKISNLFEAPSPAHVHVLVLPAKAALVSFYLKAWGKPWPRHTGTISRTEIVPAQPKDMVVDETVSGVDHGSVVEIPEKFEYICFDKMNEVNAAISFRTVEDVLVVLQEYKQLCDMMEEAGKEGGRTMGIVVTGQPGIGKTTFLLYLLLHRLENKLPTAVQFSYDHYIIFDEHGAKGVAVTVKDERLAKCWALTNSSTMPCQPLQMAPDVLIQVSQLQLSNWNAWLRQLMGTVVISDLPQMVEILAIAKELKLQPSSAFSLVNKWGPSIRTVIKIMRSQACEVSLEWLAEQLANRICVNPSAFRPIGQELPNRRYSMLLFFQAYHVPGLTNIGSRPLGTFYIPTSHLRKIFEKWCIMLTNEHSLEFFENLSPHSLTRSRDGWSYEMQMHRRLCSDGEPLSVYQGGDAMGEMIPSTNLLITVAALDKAEPNTPFYWMPAVANIPGVDGVLGDDEGNIYAVQATCAYDHSSPVKGLELVWANVGKAVRNRWCFVVVGQVKADVDKLMIEYSNELEDVTFRLGDQKVHVEVRGCIFDPSEKRVFSGSRLSSAGGSNVSEAAASASPVTPSGRPRKRLHRESGTRPLTRSQRRVLTDTGD